MLKTKKASVRRKSNSKTEKTAAVSGKKTGVRKKRSAKGSGGPVVKASPVKKVVTRRKVSKKRVATASPSPVSPEGGVRKGRPVSVEVLQRKLASSLEALKTEKQKRQALAKNARQTARTAVIERRKLKLQITALKQELSGLQNEKKSAEKQAAQQQKLEIARNDAVGRFLERWEKEYQKKNTAPTGKKKRRKRVRRAAS